MFTAADVVALGADPEHVSLWLGIRKRRKLLNSVVALKAMQREASSVGYTLAQAVQECAERSWQGFRAEYVVPRARERGHGAPMPRRKPSQMTLAERQAQLDADLAEIAERNARLDELAQHDAEPRWVDEVLPEFIDEAGSSETGDVV